MAEPGLTTMLVDVDGTVANMHKGEPGRRAPFDWHRVGEDAPIDPIIDVVQRLRGAVDYVTWMSGRSDACREATAGWLHLFAGADWAYGDELYMRTHGDFRPDELVKGELYLQHVEPKAHVRWVLDDRDKVVKMWRQRGLTVLQVADGAF
ncbi:hypothetical protein [Dactylosporangium sp. CS-033363]|uniref:phosphatase domain-containing protein n=1 Tax=Dactylosporangium sp. CS-033363 TaxID=3239935 RepID=UPI003D8DFFB1